MRPKKHRKPNPSSRGCRTMYEPQFKRTVILYAEQKSNKEARMRFGISEETIRRWRRNRREVMELAQQCIRRSQRHHLGNSSFSEETSAGKSGDGGKGVVDKSREDLDSMPLQQRLSHSDSGSTAATSPVPQESVLQSQPISPTKLKVTRQGKPQNHPPPKPQTPPPPLPPPRVCLKWNTHHMNIQSSFPTFLSKEQYVDATLVSEGKTLKCHRMILSSCSTYFEEVLSEIAPLQHPVLFMKDVPFWVLKGLCDFMYAGEVHIVQDSLKDFLDVATTLKIKGLVSNPKEEDIKPITEIKQELESPPAKQPENPIKEEKHEELPPLPSPRVAKRAAQVDPASELVKPTKREEDKMADAKVEPLKGSIGRQAKRREDKRRVPSQQRAKDKVVEPVVPKVTTKVAKIILPKISHPPRPTPTPKQQIVRNVIKQIAKQAPKASTSKVAPSTTRKTEHSKKTEKHKAETVPKDKEKEKPVLRKDNIDDPLDLLKPVYEEITKTDLPKNVPLQKSSLRERGNIPVRKNANKRVKKRRYAELDDEKDETFHSRKGTRSRPNVKIPKFYHTNFEDKESGDATIVREPHTHQDDPLIGVDVEEIKAEPVDVEENAIEMEENFMEQEQEMISHEGEEIIGNYDSPLVNIKEEPKASTPPLFEKEVLEPAPVIVDVHSVTETEDESLLNIKKEAIQIVEIAHLSTTVINHIQEETIVGTNITSEIIITNVQSIAEDSCDNGPDKDAGKSILGTVLDDDGPESGESQKVVNVVEALERSQKDAENVLGDEDPLGNVLCVVTSFGPSENRLGGKVESLDRLDSKEDEKVVTQDPITPAINENQVKESTKENTNLNEDSSLHTNQEVNKTATDPTAIIIPEINPKLPKDSTQNQSTHDELLETTPENLKVTETSATQKRPAEDDDSEGTRTKQLKPDEDDEEEFGAELVKELEEPPDITSELHLSSNEPSELVEAPLDPDLAPDDLPLLPEGITCNTSSAESIEAELEQCLASTSYVLPPKPPDVTPCKLKVGVKVASLHDDEDFTKDIEFDNFIGTNNRPANYLGDEFAVDFELCEEREEEELVSIGVEGESDKTAEESLEEEEVGVAETCNNLPNVEEAEDDMQADMDETLTQKLLEDHADDEAATEETSQEDQGLPEVEENLLEDASQLEDVLVPATEDQIHPENVSDEHQLIEDPTHPENVASPVHQSSTIDEHQVIKDPEDPIYHEDIPSKVHQAIIEENQLMEDSTDAENIASQIHEDSSSIIDEHQLMEDHEDPENIPSKVHQSIIEDNQLMEDTTDAENISSQIHEDSSSIIDEHQLMEDPEDPIYHEDIPSKVHQAIIEENQLMVDATHAENISSQIHEDSSSIIDEHQLMENQTDPETVHQSSSSTIDENQLVEHFEDQTDPEHVQQLSSSNKDDNELKEEETEDKTDPETIQQSSSSIINENQLMEHFDDQTDLDPILQSSSSIIIEDNQLIEDSQTDSEHIQQLSSSVIDENQLMEDSEIQTHLEPGHQSSPSIIIDKNQLMEDSHTDPEHVQQLSSSIINENQLMEDSQTDPEAVNRSSSSIIDDDQLMEDSLLADDDESDGDGSEKTLEMIVNDLNASLGEMKK